VLKAFAIARGLWDNLFFIFIVVIVNTLLLVTVLTMFQVVFDLLLEYNRSLS
jgi:hypothetical protein